MTESGATENMWRRFHGAFMPRERQQRIASHFSSTETQLMTDTHTLGASRRIMNLSPTITS